MILFVFIALTKVRLTGKVLLSYRSLIYLLMFYTLDSFQIFYLQETEIIYSPTDPNPNTTAKMSTLSSSVIEEKRFGVSMWVQKHSWENTTCNTFMRVSNVAYP